MSILVAGQYQSDQYSESDYATEMPLPNGVDISSLKSYSIYSQYAVIVLKTGETYAIGDNKNWPIYSSLSKTLKKWTYYQISENGKNYLVESAVCGKDYTLYLLKESATDSNRYLGYVQRGMKKGHPYFLNTSGWTIETIYGGCQTAAGIDERGAIHIIPSSITSLKGNETKIVFLPNNRLAISIAFQEKSIVCLSSFNEVYEMNINSNEFKLVEELKDECIISISGKNDHCIAVGMDGSVFSRGKNEDGRLGLGKRSNSPKFACIQALRKHVIVDASAGAFHSIFVSEKGKAYTCGLNSCGELLRGDEGEEEEEECKVLTPMLVKGFKKVRNCIAGFHNSVIFLDCRIPKNSPNQTIKLISPSPFPLMIEKSNDDDEDEDKKDYSSLKSELDCLRNSNRQLKNSNKKLENSNKQLKDSNKKLIKTTNQQKNTISQLKKEQVKAKNELKALKKQLAAPTDPAATFSVDKKKLLVVPSDPAVTFPVKKTALQKKQLPSDAKKAMKPFVIKKKPKNPVVIKKKKSDPIKQSNIEDELNDLKKKTERDDDNEDDDYDTNDNEDDDTNDNEDDDDDTNDNEDDDYDTNDNEDDDNSFDNNDDDDI